MWIEIRRKIVRIISIIKSRPARALWIEICIKRRNWQREQVEAREGLVD